MTLASDGGAFTYRAPGSAPGQPVDTAPGPVAGSDPVMSQQAVFRDRLQFVPSDAWLSAATGDREQDPRCPRL